MKKLSFLFLLFLLFSKVHGQSLSFDQTLDYIKGKITEYELTFTIPKDGYSSYVYKVEGIECQKNGKLRLLNLKSNQSKQLNLLDLKPLIADDNSIYITQKQHPNGRTVISFGSEEIEYVNMPVEEAKRLAKAFNYLRSLCTKEKDPFD